MADRKPEKLEPADFLLSSQNDMGLGLALLEPGTGRIKRANAVLCAIFGFGERELAALPSFAALVPADHQAGVREHLRNMDSQTATFELTAVHKSGRRIWAEVRLRQIPMKSGAFVAALVSDITRRREAEEQVLLLETITLAVNDAPDFPTALGVVLRKVCVATGWEYGIAWVPTADGKALEISPANYGAGDNIARFQTALHGVTLSQGEDLPGRAWVLRQPQWADDVALLRSFRRQTILREFGVRISMAIPVTADDQVVAVLEFCVSDRHAQAKDFFLGLASTIAPQLGSLFQRKRAEEERDRFFSISPDLLCISGFDGFFRHINGAWQKILGYSMQELMSRPIREFVHPEDRERTQEELARLKTTSDTKSYENRFVAKDGSVRWIQWSAISDVKKGRIYKVGRDITERKRRSDELYRTNKFLDQIIENIPDMIFIKDAADLRFIRFNRAGESLLGLPRESMIGKNDYDFFPPEEADFFTEKDRVVLNDGKLVDIPEEVIHTKKGVRILHTKKIPILDLDGRPLYLLGISEDITEKKTPTK